MVEDLNIGVWAGKETSPDWDSEGLSRGFLRALDNRTASVAMREKAREIGRIAQVRTPGRVEAARIIAKLAASGK